MARDAALALMCACILLMAATDLWFQKRDERRRRDLERSGGDGG